MVPTRPRRAPKEKEDRLLRLQRVAKALNSELHLDRLLEIIVDHVIELVGRRARLPGAPAKPGQPRGPRRAQLRARGGRVARGGVLAAHRRAGVPHGAAGAHGERGRGPALPGEPLDQRDPRAQRAVHPASRSAGRAFGAIYVDNRLQKGAFGEAELQTLIEPRRPRGDRDRERAALRGERAPREGARGR